MILLYTNLHLRFDRDSIKNKDIKEERLSPDEVIALEQRDTERSAALEEHCDKYVTPAFEGIMSNYVFACGIGAGSVNVGYDGLLRLCSDLYHPDYMFDLRQGTIKHAIDELVPKVKSLTSNRDVFLKSCRSCSLVNLCQWCPADAYLEAGELDVPVAHFCTVAHRRAKSVQRDNLKEPVKDTIME